MDLPEPQTEGIHSHLVAKVYTRSEERALILQKVIYNASNIFFPQNFSAVKTHRSHLLGLRRLHFLA